MRSHIRALGEAVRRRENDEAATVPMSGKVKFPSKVEDAFVALSRVLTRRLDDASYRMKVAKGELHKAVGLLEASGQSRCDAADSLEAVLSDIEVGFRVGKDRLAGMTQQLPDGAPGRHIATAVEWIRPLAHDVLAPVRAYVEQPLPPRRLRNMDF